MRQRPVVRNSPPLAQVVPPGAELLVVAGNDADGAMPEGVADQLGNCLANIDRIPNPEGYWLTICSRSTSG